MKCFDIIRSTCRVITPWSFGPGPVYTNGVSMSMKL